MEENTSDEQDKGSNDPSRANPLEHVSEGLRRQYRRHYATSSSVSQGLSEDDTAERKQAKLQDVDPQSNIASEENPLAWGYYHRNPWGVDMPSQAIVNSKPGHARYSVKQQRYVPEPPAWATADITQEARSEATSNEPSWDNPMLHPGLRGGFHKHAARS